MQYARSHVAEFSVMSPGILFPGKYKVFLRNNWMRLFRLRMHPGWYGRVRLLQAVV